MDHSSEAGLRVGKLASGHSCSGLSRSNEGRADEPGCDGRVEDGLQPLPNRQTRSLAAIFESESFKAWTRDIAAHAKRDAEKRAARRSEPSNSFRMVNVEARREFGTVRVLRGRIL